MKKSNSQKEKQNQYQFPAGARAASGASYNTEISISVSDVSAVTDLLQIISQHCRTLRLSVMRLLRTFDPSSLELQKVLGTFRREQVEAALALLCDWETVHNSVVDEKLFLPCVAIEYGSPRLLVITNIGEPIELSEEE